MFDKELIRLLGPNKKYVVYAVFLMIAGTAAGVGVTASICFSVSLLIRGAEVSAYAIPAAAAAVCIAVRYITSCSVGRIKDLIGRSVKKDLRMRAYDKILKLGAAADGGSGQAGLTQICLEGIEQLDLYYSLYLPQFFFALSAPFLLFFIFIGIDVRTAAVLLACVPLIPLSIVAVSKYAKRIFAKYWGKYTSMGDTFLDSVQGLNDLKIFNADAARQTKMNRNAEEFRKMTMKVLVMQLASVTIMDLVAFGGAGVGAAVALSGLAAGRISPAETLFLILTAAEFFLPLRALGSAFHVAMNGAGAGKKIIALLNTPDPIWGSKEISSAAVRLENVVFSYDGHRRVVDGVNMSFPSKGMTAVVGESGCGKSTVVNLIIGACRPQSGKVLIGGEQLENLSRSLYYSHLAAVSCNSYLFNDTVKANFRMVKKEISDAEIYEALKKVNLDDFVRENGGLDRVISEDACDLSGGQKQRLLLAAALVADKDIYIFDEATSNIDIESESLIMKNIEELSRRHCVILISHRLENVVRADRIYCMEEGKVEESGTHEELMSLGGRYARLYATQKEQEEGYKYSVSRQTEVNA